MNFKNTQPEIKVQRMLLELGVSFKKHNKNLFGTPDIAIPNRKIILNIKGCFWHQHGCNNSKMPKSRKLYWYKKFQRNKINDSEVAYALALEGEKDRLYLVYSPNEKTGKNLSHDDDRFKLVTLSIPTIQSSWAKQANKRAD